jgi:hypothetical protein
MIQRDFNLDLFDPVFADLTIVITSFFSDRDR